MSKQQEIVYLTPFDLEVICTELSRFFSTISDPPPDYDHSQFDKIDSILSIPQRTFDGKDLYPSIYEKAACYLYFINKLHPFSNGNKRISIVATVVFLRLNNINLEVEQDLMYKFAKKVTESHSDQQTEFKLVVDFITIHCISTPNS